MEYSLLLPNEIEETVRFFHPRVDEFYDHEFSFSIYPSVRKMAEESIYHQSTYEDGNTTVEHLVECVDLEKLGKKIIERDPGQLPTTKVVGLRK